MALRIMNIYYQNSHTKNPLLTDRQNAANEKANKDIQMNIERLEMKRKPFIDELEKLDKELKTKKQYISTAQIRVHRKRVARLKQEIESINIQIQMLEK